MNSIICYNIANYIYIKYGITDFINYIILEKIEVYLKISNITKAQKFLKVFL